MLVEEFQPSDLEMPERFNGGWRPGQYSVLTDAIDAETRFTGHCVGCGFGKSLIFTAFARMLGGRTLILTPFKGLQDQLREQFPFVTDLRGKGSYFCSRLHTNCEMGAPRCDARASALGSSMCPHRSAVKEATESEIVVTNYSCWLHQTYGQGIGTFDTLIMDEADTAEGALSDFLSFHLSARECLGDLRYKAAPHWNDGLSDWAGWASSIKSKLRADVDDAEKDAKKSDNSSLLEHFFYLRNLLRKIETLSNARPEYWVEEVTQEGIKFDPIWPGRSAEKFLFRGIKRVLLFSGTLNTKTMDVLGLRKDDYTFFDYPSPFHPASNPLILVPTGAFKYPVGSELLDKTISLFDAMVDKRLDRKGIFQSVSFKHLEHCLERTRHKKLFLTNETKYAGGSRKTSDVVEVFKKSPPPTILGSPSITAGWDFPDDQCRYQAILKVPFPDTTSEVSQRRKKLDPEYYDNETMRTLVQITSRPMRSVYDWCENWIFDTRVGWFLARKKHLAPKWFLGNNGAWRFRKLPEGTMPEPMKE